MEVKRARERPGKHETENNMGELALQAIGVAQTQLYANR